MKNPIKIIHKIKNNNRKNQYKVYIFIGSLVPINIMEILTDIEKDDLLSTLLNISKKKYSEMEDYYGEYWYKLFFINDHIKNIIKYIIDTTSKKKELINKYGEEWLEKHIFNPSVRKLAYSFSNNYYNMLLQTNKIKTKNIKENITFQTYNKKLISESFLNQEGGDNDYIDDDDNDDNDDDNKIIKDDYQENNEETSEAINIEYDNITDIKELYSHTIETDKNIKHVTDMISDVINNSKWEKKINKLQLNYDDTNDNINYDILLNDVYEKIYITDQYIYWDDTIKTIRNKITVSIPISQQFGKINLLPETLYFWSEYIYDKNKDSIMIGQKWIRKNDLLKLDIEPNDNIKIYEKLRGNLSYLKDYFGYKIKREDDENNILSSYSDYITDNEIFMLDIYNDLGLKYNPETEDKKNVFDVYIMIYYPMISYERYEQILKFLNSESEFELTYNEKIFDNIKNETKLDNIIENTVEETKMKIIKVDKYFYNNHIIQSIIHVNIQDPKNITGTISEYKINLYRIFENFIVNDKYPFLQYQTQDTSLTYKFYTEINNDNKVEIEKNDYNQENLSKWFESSIYGISFKIRMNNNKYISINLYDTGRIDYRITWKEDEKSTVTDINNTFIFVKDLLKKINSENKKIKIIIPNDDKFKYAFINSIQKFELPNKMKINHNELSEFSRFFFPYVTLVREPKAREAKIKSDEDKSKYGTYLRYKRINKFDNKLKLQLRILYYLRNFDFSDKDLIEEISKQFNISLEEASVMLDEVKVKYKYLSKKSKKLKKPENIPKVKLPGVGIDVQGKDSSNYKIRITGARSKEQLDDIINFMKVLINLYTEIYLYKNDKYNKIKDILKGLSKIAQRKYKVFDLVNYDTGNVTVKTLTSLDKDRLGFKPIKGQNQWTRSCQNSGTKVRRPIITPQDQVDKLIHDGYTLNDKTGYYEKMVDVKIKGKKYNSILKAVKLNSGDIINYFTCDPSTHNEFMYIGFLARGNNPNDLCMPCCFKKNQTDTVNKEKKNYYLKCLGEGNIQNDTENTNINKTLDKLYILRDTNKIQDGRYIYLSKYLDIFFNKIWDNDVIIKNHYLTESNSGYFFKYTVKHNNFNLLSAIANIYELTISEIIDLLIKFLENDTNDKYFNYLNNGDIIETFNTRKEYINFIKISTYLEYDIIGELCAIPNVISKKGINFYILNKYSIIKNEENKDKFYLDCLNPENVKFLDDDRDIIILVKEDKYYFPIYKVIKKKSEKKIQIIKKFNNNDNIINELKKYHNNSCNNILINQSTFNNNLISKSLIYLLKIKIVKQYIDNRHKCRYLELENGLYLPTEPSGIDYNIGFSNIKNIKPLLLKETLKLLDKVNKDLKLKYTGKIIFYDKKDDKLIKITSLLLDNNLTIPVKSEFIKESSIKKMGLLLRYQPLEEMIDIEIINYNNEAIIDDRLINVKKHNYNNESYNLYKLELSLFLEENDKIKQNIINIVRSDKNKEKKKDEIRKILLSLLSAKPNKHFGIINNIEIKYENMQIKNSRDYCKTNITKDECSNNLYCKWHSNKCYFQLYQNTINDFINKLTEEIISNDIKFKELIQDEDYYVSDIVDYSKFSFRNHQKIISYSNFNITKLLSELFGQDKIPKIGRGRNKNKQLVLENNNPKIFNLGKQYIQQIVSNKDSIIRSYINCYYWINNPLFDVNSRNLGYENDLQTTLTYLFKANIIDFIQSIDQSNQNNINKNISSIKKYLSKYYNENDNFFNSVLNNFRKVSFNSDGKTELYILSFLIPYPIVVYDNYSNVKYIFLEGEIDVNEKTIKNFTADDKLNKTIFIKFDFENSKTIPKNIYSIYY